MDASEAMTDTSDVAVPPPGGAGGAAAGNADPYGHDALVERLGLGEFADCFYEKGGRVAVIEELRQSARAAAAAALETCEVPSECDATATVLRVTDWGWKPYAPGGFRYKGGKNFDGTPIRPDKLPPTPRRHLVSTAAIDECMTEAFARAGAAGIDLHVRGQRDASAAAHFFASLSGHNGIQASPKNKALFDRTVVELLRLIAPEFGLEVKLLDHFYEHLRMLLNPHRDGAGKETIFRILASRNGLAKGLAEMTAGSSEESIGSRDCVRIWQIPPGRGLMCPCVELEKSVRNVADEQLRKAAGLEDGQWATKLHARATAFMNVKAGIAAPETLEDETRPDETGVIDVLPLVKDAMGEAAAGAVTWTMLDWVQSLAAAIARAAGRGAAPPATPTPLPFGELRDALVAQLAKRAREKAAKDTSKDATAEPRPEAAVDASKSPPVGEETVDVCLPRPLSLPPRAPRPPPRDRTIQHTPLRHATPRTARTPRAGRAAAARGARRRAAAHFDRVARTRMWLASLRRTDTNATVVLLASGFDGGELARAFRDPAFDRVVAVAPSELRFRARREGDGLLPPALAPGRGRDSAIQPRDDGAGTTLKFWAWALADFDGVVVADADVCWNGAFAGPYGRGSHRPAARFHFTSANELEGFAAELLRRRVPFAAAAERGNRDYDGFNSHFFWVRPSLDVFALLRDKAASGDFVPYTNTEQDVFDTVFAPHRHSFEALGIKPPTHEHTKGRCAGNDEPSSPTHAATGEFAECYASRYPDLYDAFCRHPSGCDINALGHHYRDHGASGGRIFRCGGCDACNYTVTEEGRTEWAACAR